MNEKTKKVVGVGLLTAVVVVLQLTGAAIKFGMFSITLTLAPIIVGAALYGVLAGGWLGLAFGAAVLISGDAAPFLGVNPVATVAIVLLKGMLAGIVAGAVFKGLEKRDKRGELTATAAAPIIGTTVFAVLYSVLVLYLIDQKLAQKVGDNKTLVTALVCMASCFIASLIAVAVYKVFQKDKRLGSVVVAGIAAPLVNTGVFAVGCYLFFMPIINKWASAAGVKNAGLFVLTGVIGFNFVVELSVNLLLSGAIVRILNIARKKLS